MLGVNSCVLMGRFRNFGCFLATRQYVEAMHKTCAVTNGVGLSRFDEHEDRKKLREKGPLLELSTLLHRSSCIFELGTSKYIITPSMVFGCSDDVLRLCPVVSQTPVGDQCILHRQPKILEAFDLRREFRKKYGLLPPPNPYKSENTFSWRFRKGTTYPYLPNNIFPKFSPHRKNLASLTNRPPLPVQHPYIHGFNGCASHAAGWLASPLLTLMLYYRRVCTITTGRLLWLP